MLSSIWQDVTMCVDTESCKVSGWIWLDLVYCDEVCSIDYMEE